MEEIKKIDLQITAYVYFKDRVVLESETVYGEQAADAACSPYMRAYLHTVFPA